MGKIKLEKIDYGKNQQKFYNIWIDSDNNVHKLTVNYGRIYQMGVTSVKLRSENYFECKKELDKIVHQKLSKGYDLI